MKVLGVEVTFLGTIYITILAIVSIPAINTIISLSQQPSWSRNLGDLHPSTLHSSYGSLITTLTFTDNQQYTNLSSKYDHLWEEELLTKTGGFITDPSSGGHDGDPSYAGISMFHQLHCLSMIRMALKDSGERMPHLTHCLDYLRQVCISPSSYACGLCFP